MYSSASIVLAQHRSLGGNGHLKSAGSQLLEGKGFDKALKAEADAEAEAGLASAFLSQ